MFKILKISFLIFTLAFCCVQAQAKKNIATVNKTKQDFIFVGCAGEETAFKEVSETIIASEEAWNKHQLEELITFYAPNFVSKDGMDLTKIRNNLSEFWSQYNNARIEAMPATIYVCGNYATVQLTEITTATGQVEDPKVLSFPPKFKANIRGVTTLKKIGNNWKIISEEILAEEMWKYYGPTAEKLLEEGKVKLIIPTPVKEGENFIAQLDYKLPEKIQAVALIDKILLTEFPESKTEKLDKAKKKEREIESVRRTIEGGSSEEGLRRLFTSNTFGQDELVRAQIELVSFENKGPSLVGIIGISQRVVPKKIPQTEKGNNGKTITKTFKEESLGQTSHSEEAVKPKG